ncbi:MAG: hypothetical protein ACPGRD_08290 [Planktomarina sp.]
MTKYEGTSLNPVADSLVIHALRGVLASDFRDATDTNDLSKRLNHKGYGIAGGYLATFPEGKKICPLIAI